MLEEKGGWVAGEDQRKDEEMAEAVIEVLAQASNHDNEDHFNPFREQVGEILPTNLERNFSGFLVRKDPITYKVDPIKVCARIARLKEELLIAKFVGPKPTLQDMDEWLKALNQSLGDHVLTFCMNVGKGYFFLKGEDSDALNHALMLSPHKSKWGTCMIQSWVPGFNLDNPSNLAFPTWVALRRLPFEHHDQAFDIASTLGEVIGIDTSNEWARDPRFCVNLMVSKGWVTSIDLETENGTLPTQKVIVDYDKLPMRCKACHSWLHRVRDCTMMQKRPLRGGKRSAQAPHSFQLPHSYKPDKGKNVVMDEEGFQQVRNRKNTKRNILNIVNDERRSSAFALAEEIRAAKTRSKAMEGEVSHLRGGQTINEISTATQQDGQYRTRQQTSEEGIVPEDPKLKNTKVAVRPSKVATTVTEEDRTEHIATPVEGRGDPASTMLWSPRKLAGQKRPLDREEPPDSEDEVGLESDEEDEEGSESEEEDVADTPRLTEAEEVTGCADIGVRDQMQVDDSSDVGGKSPSQPQEVVPTPEASPMAVEAHESILENEKVAGESGYGRPAVRTASETHGGPVARVALETPRGSEVREVHERDLQTSNEGGGGGDYMRPPKPGQPCSRGSLVEDEATRCSFDTGKMKSKSLGPYRHLTEESERNLHRSAEPGQEGGETNPASEKRNEDCRGGEEPARSKEGAGEPSVDLVASTYEESQRLDP